MKIISDRYQTIFWLLLLGAIWFGEAQSQETNEDDDFLQSLVSEFSNSDKQLIEGRFSEGEELLFSVEINRTEIGSISSIATNDAIFVHFDDYLLTLDFPILFSNRNLLYEGWFISEAQAFRLSLVPDANEHLNASINGIQETLLSNDYLINGDDLYVSQSRLSQLFGLTHSFNYQKLILSLNPPSNFPLLAKLRREGKLIRKRGDRTPSFVNLPRSYEILSPQIIDFALASSYREQTKDVRHNYTLTGARDIALLHTQYSLAGTNNGGLSNARINFSRESNNAKGLLGTGVTRFEFGDVRGVRQGTGQTLSESLGFSIQNNELTNQFDSEVITIDGDLSQGWDVELYRNGTLISQQLDVQTGRYEFVDVRLIFGENNFEVIMYGPQGQIRRRTLNRLVTDQTSSSKPVTYQVSLNRLNKTVLGIENQNLDQDLGYNFSGRVSSFVGDDLALNFGYQSIFGGRLDSNNVTVGASTVLLGTTLLDVSLGYNDDDIVPINVNLRGRLFDQSVALSYRNSDLSKTTGDSTQQLNLSVEGPIRIIGDFSVPISQTFNISTNNEIERFNYTNAIGMSFGRFSFFHNFSYDKTTVNNVEEDKILGGINIQSNFGSLFTRLSASYTPDSEETFDVIRLNASWNALENVNLSATAIHDRLNDNLFTTLTASYLAEDYRISGRIGYSDTSGYDIGINASFSLSGQNIDYDYIDESAFSNTRVGALTVRVFFDKNLNAVFDEGDTLLPDVKVEGIQFFKSAFTDENGIATLTRLANQTSSDIVLDRNSLPEPFLTPYISGVSITARAGLVDHLDYPVVISSELEGIVEVLDKGVISTLNRVRLDLFDSRGELVKQVVSEYDGYFYFDTLLPGSYILKINELDAEKHDLLTQAPFDVEVPNTPDILVKDLRYNKRPYQGGFISLLGEFSTYSFANLFALSLEKKYPNLSLYIEQNTDSKKYSVFTNFLNDEISALSECESLQLISIDCSVTEFMLPTVRL